MHRNIVTIHQSGRFTLPVAIRRELDLHPGDSVVWSEQDGELVFRKAEPHEIAEPRSDPDRALAPMNDTDIKSKE